MSMCVTDCPYVLLFSLLSWNTLNTDIYSLSTTVVTDSVSYVWECVTLPAYNLKVVLPRKATQSNEITRGHYPSPPTPVSMSHPSVSGLWGHDINVTQVCTIFRFNPDKIYHHNNNFISVLTGESLVGKMKGWWFLQTMLRYKPSKWYRYSLDNSINLQFTIKNTFLNLGLHNYTLKHVPTDSTNYNHRTRELYNTVFHVIAWSKLQWLGGVGKGSRLWW